jgi:hypothetical protein
MKIVDNITKTVPFCTLYEGDVFRDADGVLLMKMTAFDSTDGAHYNCISLVDACPYGVDANERVTKIANAVLTLD